METYKITTKDMKKMGMDLSKLILIESLGYYGFNNTIINKMVKHNIFPNVYFYRGKPYVLRASIFEAVETIMENTMLIYDQNAKNEETVERFNKMLEEEALKITPEEVKYMEDNNMSIADYLKSKIEASESLISEQTND